jgi:hypothetical protein
VIRAALLLACLAAPAAAQDTMGFDSDPALVGTPKKETPRDAVEELGLAVSLAFDATTWVSVGVSSPPAQAATQLIRNGHYRFELIQLVLMARTTTATLLDVTAKRAKGKKLRELSKEFDLDYDELYDRASILSADVDRRLETIVRVRADRPNAPLGVSGRKMKKKAGKRRPRREK